MSVFDSIDRIRHAALREVKDWFAAILNSLPGRLGLYCRQLHLCWLIPSSPKNLFVDPGFFCSGYKNIQIGSNCRFGRICSVYSDHGKIVIGEGLSANDGAWISSDYGEIRIGSNVLIGPYTVLRAANHRFKPGDLIKNQGHRSGMISIGNNVWIGANVTVVPGADIGDNSVIAAGSVVNQVIPPNSVAAGVPAKVIDTIRAS